MTWLNVGNSMKRIIQNIRDVFTGYACLFIYPSFIRFQFTFKILSKRYRNNLNNNSTELRLETPPLFPFSRQSDFFRVMQKPPRGCQLRRSRGPLNGASLNHWRNTCSLTKMVWLFRETHHVVLYKYRH